MSRPGYMRHATPRAQRFRLCIRTCPGDRTGIEAWLRNALSSGSLRLHECHGPQPHPPNVLIAHIDTPRNGRREMVALVQSLSCRPDVHSVRWETVPAALDMCPRAQPETAMSSGHDCITAGFSDQVRAAAEAVRHPDNGAGP